jgi:hypothetical protein
MLRTKNEGILELKESETKGESHVGTGSNNQSENRQITQQEPVKIKVDRTNVGTTYMKRNLIAEKEIDNRAK